MPGRIGERWSGVHGNEPGSSVVTQMCLQVRRRVPVVTIVVDTPERIARSFEIVDDVTNRTGLVTSEMVPATAALTEGRHVHGGLRLARRSS
jgi:PII-like signaling protein